ncbi:MAG TPA: C25 family peptidase propeptide domain-containing protein, partial [Candidatus Cloacimonadota bacterium]|nr:C25 family peptidase propeptide domain-containing protein [Candidatus Cloacimonadota bacterium]
MRRLAIALVLILVARSLWGSFSLSAQRGAELIVDYQLQPFQITESQGFTQIRIDDVDYPAVPGAPSVPFTEFKVAIPPYGSASYEILSSTSENLSLPSRLQPVPTIDASAEFSEYQYIVDESLYQQGSMALISNAARLNFRGHPFYAFTFNPFSYDGDRQLRVTTSAQIRISLQGDISQRSSYQTDEISDLMIAQFLNPDNARYWQETQRNGVHYTDFDKSGWWMRIETDKPGMYKITASQ